MERSASPDEAAAIAAAIARFLAETTPLAPAADSVDSWTRAALLEGVGAKRTIMDPEGGMR
jgi:hypothetical protein